MREGTFTVKYENMTVNIENLPQWIAAELVDCMQDIDEIKGLLFFKKEYKKHLTK